MSWPLIIPFTCRGYPGRYLADVGSGKFHDLTNVHPSCNIVNIIDRHRDIAYKYMVDAKRDGYLPCPYCMPAEQEK